MKDDPEFNIAFVSMVQQFPCLYDNTSLDYSNKTQQYKAWETIAKQVNESVVDCKDRWKNLRGCFTRYLKNRSGEGSTGHRYRKPYYLAQHLSFILPFTKTRSHVRKGTRESNYNHHDEDDDDEDDDRVCVEDDVVCEDVDTIPDNGLCGKESNHSAHEEEDDVEKGYDEYEERDRSDPDSATASHLKRVIKTEKEDWHGEKRPRQLDDDDSDLYFLKSLLPDMRVMDGSQKRRLKIGILQLCEDILNEAAAFHT